MNGAFPFVEPINNATSTPLVSRPIPKRATVFACPRTVALP
jgi:hypothetical protein